MSQYEGRDKRVKMSNENEPNQKEDSKNPPHEGKIARLRYRRRHPHLYRQPRVRRKSTIQGIVTTLLQHGGTSAI